MFATLFPFSKTLKHKLNANKYMLGKNINKVKYMWNKKTKPKILQSFLSELYDNPTFPAEIYLGLFLGRDDVPKESVFCLGNLI